MTPWAQALSWGHGTSIE